MRSGKKWFKCLQTGRIACADESGTYPNQTEDGILWLNKEMPIVMSQDDDWRIYVSTPVIKAKDGDKSCHVGSSIDDILFLVKEHGMELKMKSSNGELVSVTEMAA